MEQSKLKFLKIIFSLTSLEKILIPKDLKGNIFRGAFGLKFKELNCRSTPICIERCVDPKCLYGQVFEPHYTEGTPSGMKDIPRPFVLTNVSDDRTEIYPGESFNIGFNLFGWACDYYAHFITAVKAIGEEGIGPLRGKFTVRSVFSEDWLGNREVIYDKENVLKEAKPFSIPDSFQIESKVAKIELKTPTVIKYDSQIINEPEFYQIFLRIRDRVSAIAYFHNGIELTEDFKLLELEAREVKTLKSEWKKMEVKRRSSRTHILQDMSGIVGYALYDFQTAERAEIFAPWLKIGEIVNVGKNSVWGMGEIKTILNWKTKQIRITEGRYVSRK